MKIESLIPLQVKRPSGDILLTPGTPVEFTEEEGLKLLTKAKRKVRLVEPSGTLIEPAERPDGQTANDPNLLGDGNRTDSRSDGARIPGQSWGDILIVTTFEGQIRWINADRLRSKKQFETQKPVREVELVRVAKL